jgi:hypothetical protein
MKKDTYEQFDGDMKPEDELREELEEAGYDYDEESSSHFDNLIN